MLSSYLDVVLLALSLQLWQLLVSAVSIVHVLIITTSFNWHTYTRLTITIVIGVF